LVADWALALSAHALSTRLPVAAQVATLIQLFRDLFPRRESA
jgi:hypothetical protein